jgi:hypothetical protein
MRWNTAERDVPLAASTASGQHRHVIPKSIAADAEARRRILERCGACEEHLDEGGIHAADCTT